jgi:hypothetical protein
VQPVRLSDEAMVAILAASHPLPPDRRSAFLEDVARELACLPEVGDGACHRVVMMVQRKYFDPPNTHAVPQRSRGNRTARSAIEA